MISALKDNKRRAASDEVMFRDFFNVFLKEKHYYIRAFLFYACCVSADIFEALLF